MKTIKVRCNGPGRHVNEVNLDRVLEPYPIYKDLKSNYQNLNLVDIPERIVLNCRECTYKVIITRKIIEESMDYKKI